MEETIKRLKEMLNWSDRLGSDEIFEIQQIIKVLQKETKEKISNTLKGKISKKKRKVKQLDMNRNLIKEFSSITEAKLQTGIKGINNVLTGRAKKAGGYLWE